MLSSAELLHLYMDDGTSSQLLDYAQSMTNPTIYKVILKHPVTDRYLDNARFLKKENMKKNTPQWKNYLSRMARAGEMIARIVSLVLIYLIEYNLNVMRFDTVKNGAGSDQSNVPTYIDSAAYLRDNKFIFWFIGPVIIYWFYVLKEEITQFRIPTQIRTSIKRLDQFRIYLFDAWNYIDFFYVLMLFLYLIVMMSDLFTYTVYENTKIVNEIRSSLFTFVMVFNSLRALQVWTYFNEFDSSVEATLFIIIDALKYLLAASIMWLGLALAGIAFMAHNQNPRCHGMQFGNCLLYSIQLIFGVSDWPTDEIDYMPVGFSIFWLVYVVFIIVIIFNGLISIMTYSLPDHMSPEMARQRDALRSYTRLKDLPSLVFSPEYYKNLKSYYQERREVMSKQDENIKADWYSAKLKIYSNSPKHFLHVSYEENEIPRDDKDYHITESRYLYSIRLVISELIGSQNSKLGYLTSTFSDRKSGLDKDNSDHGTLLNILAKLETVCRDKTVSQTLNVLFSEEENLVAIKNPNPNSNMETPLHNINKYSNFALYQITGRFYDNRVYSDRFNKSPWSYNFRKIEKYRKLKPEDPLFSLAVKRYENFLTSVYYYTRRYSVEGPSDLDLSRLKLTEFEMSFFRVREMKKMKELNLSNNKLEKLVLNNTRGLSKIIEKLDLSYNQIYKIDRRE